jgi:phage-related minor tail protein
VSVKVAELFGEVNLKDLATASGKRITRNVGQALAQLDNEVVIDAAVDPLTLAKSLDKARSEVDRLKKDIAEKAKLGADTSQLTVDLAKAEQQVRRAKKDLDLNIKATLDADEAKLKAATREAHGLLDGVAGTTATAKVDADVSDVDAGAAEGEASLLDMVGGWQTAVVGAAAGLGTAVGVKLVSSFFEAVERDTETDRLAASLLNVDDSETARLGRISSAIYAGAWGDSIEHVNSAIAGIGTTVDWTQNLDDATLTRYTTSALDFAKIFDQDVNRVIGTAGVLMETGMARDFEHALDLMASALKRTPLHLRGDVFDASDEYAKNFETVAWSGEQMFAALVRAAPAGTYAIDKTGDAIGEMTKLAVSGSTTVVEAYQAIGLDADEMARKLANGGEEGYEASKRIAEGLLRVEDPGKRAELAVALIGTPLEDLSVHKIPDFLAIIAEMGPGLEGVEGTMSASSQRLNENVGTDIEGLKRRVETAVQDWTFDVWTAYDENGIEGVKEKLGEDIGKLGDLWDTHGPAIVEKAETWWEETASPAIGAAIEAALAAAWDAAWNATKERVTTSFDDMGNSEWWTDAMNKVAFAANPVGESASWGFERLGGLFGIKGFAEGGLVTSPTVGLIGEGQHDEIISPIPTLEGVMRRELARAGGGGGQSGQPLVLQLVVDGRTLAEVTDTRVLGQRLGTSSRSRSGGGG